MEILRGLMNNQVLQRNKRNVCEAMFSGFCTVDEGFIQAKVCQNGRVISGFDFKLICKIKKSIFDGVLSGIPAGGPYCIDLRSVNCDGIIADELKIKNILVGDVWVLAGQSNMGGFGFLKDSAKPHRMVRAFYMNDLWAEAKDPIHNYYDAVDAVHVKENGGKLLLKDAYRGTGPGAAFGLNMYKLTGVPQGLIACAHGGSSTVQWKPTSVRANSLYGAMLRRIYKNGKNIAGVLWYQGCADGYEKQSKYYTRRTQKIISSICKDLHNLSMPFVMAQIASFHCTKLTELYDRESSDFCKHWNDIQEQQRLLPELVPNIATVPMIDLPLDDMIHLSGKSQQRAGKRFALAAVALQKNSSKSSIDLGYIRTVTDKTTGYLNIKISYENVEDKLISHGYPSGYSLVTRNRVLFDAIFKVELESKQVIVYTCIDALKRPKLFLHYGFGTSPLCNITDSNDRSLPVFGPHEL